MIIQEITLPPEILRTVDTIICRTAIRRSDSDILEICQHTFSVSGGTDPADHHIDRIAGSGTYILSAPDQLIPSAVNRAENFEPSRLLCWK